MGSYGVGSFENDTAADRIGEIEARGRVARRMPALIEDAPLALVAIAAVVDPKKSELYWLREGSLDLADWLTVVKDLRRRLGGWRTLAVVVPLWRCISRRRTRASR